MLPDFAELSVAIVQHKYDQGGGSKNCQVMYDKCY